MLLLGEVRSEPMTMHAELIRSSSESYGPGCWNIIYTAGVRVRREYMERIRRRLQSEIPASTLRSIVPLGRHLPAGLLAVGCRDSGLLEQR
eukprot:15297358-Alexandrium_andersonii.AAC.1